MGNSTIVYVEDEPDYQKLVSKVLSNAGFMIHLAGTGREGKKLLERQNPDLLLLDINLPDTDGYTMCRQLRQEKSWQDLQVLMVTVRKQMKEWIKGFESGANDYVSKPINPPELVQRVEACLTGQSAPGSCGADKAEFRLIQAARAGNRGAFDILVRQHRLPMLLSIDELVQNEAEAEDIVSRAFMTAFERIGQFQGDSPFATWVYRIAMNDTYNRKNTRRQPTHVSIDEIIGDEEEGIVPKSLIEHDAAIEGLENTPERDKAKAAVAEVPKSFRKILEWHILDGMSYERIARKLSVPTGTIWSRAAEAKRRLRRACARIRRRKLPFA